MVPSIIQKGQKLRLNCSSLGVLGEKVGRHSSLTKTHKPETAEVQPILWLGFALVPFLVSRFCKFKVILEESDQVYREICEASRLGRIFKVSVNGCKNIVL